MHGNFWEWVEDCRNEDYAGAPSDGSAWWSGDCEQRVLRGGGGGSWSSGSRGLRSASRGRGPAGGRGSGLCFRVVRTLTP